MKLIAQKPCSFGGKKFFIGAEVPADLVLDPEAQTKMGVLAIADGEEAPAESVTTTDRVEKMTVIVRPNGEDMPLELTREGLQDVVDVRTSNLEEAGAIVARMTDADALILLHISDHRKTIKEAAENRAKELEGDR